MKSTILLLILLVVSQGCISTSRKQIYQANLHSDYVIDSVSNVKVLIDSCCLKMYDSFQNSENILDVFYYDFSARSSSYHALRILKKEFNSKIETYRIKDGEIIEIESPANIEDLLSTFNNKGNFLVIDQIDMLNNNINTLEVRKKGESVFTLTNYTGSIKYKEQDFQKVNNGVALIELLNNKTLP